MALSSYGYDDGRRVVRVAELSARHREIGELVRQGLTNREVAEVLGIQMGTVRVQLNVMYRVLGVQAGPGRLAKRRALARLFEEETDA